MGGAKMEEEMVEEEEGVSGNCFHLPEDPVMWLKICKEFTVVKLEAKCRSRRWSPLEQVEDRVDPGLQMQSTVAD